MSRYMWVVKCGGYFLGADLCSLATNVITAHMFHSAEEADGWCPAEGEVKKILVYIEELN